MPIREMVSEGAALVAASTEESLATALAGVFIRAGVVCEESNDPIGVELADAAKNAAALASGASGATEAQGLNAAGAAAGHILRRGLGLGGGSGRPAGVDDRPCGTAPPQSSSGRTTVPPPARWLAAVPPGFWRRLRQRTRPA